MGKTKTKLVEVEEKIDLKIKDSTKAGKKKITVNSGKFFINACKNNTLISFTDNIGNVFCQSSSGASGFKNTKKGTPYAGAKAMEFLLNKLNNFDLNEVKVIVKGIGPGRDPSIRALFNANINIVSIEDRTSIPFGGPTPKKARRV